MLLTSGGQSDDDIDVDVDVDVVDFAPGQVGRVMIAARDIDQGELAELERVAS